MNILKRDFSLFFSIDAVDRFIFNVKHLFQNNVFNIYLKKKA